VRGVQIPPLKPAHLAARFLDVVTSRRLDDAERHQAESWLNVQERTLFFSQPAADQRHGLTSARRVAAFHPQRTDLARAALLHDIGKRHARLGAAGRMLATVSGAFGWKTTHRFAAYLGHGPVGAAELHELGAEEIVVAFARSHHGSRPEAIATADWQVLVGSDRSRWTKPSKEDG